MSDASVQELLASYPQECAATAGKGYPGHLEAAQTTALNHLRDLLKAHGQEDRLDDATLLRFLRARKFDVAKTLEMYQACEKWRTEFGTNTILKDFHYKEKEEVMKFYPQFYHKTDKEGRPVYYEILGKVDIYAMYKFTSQERMLKNLVWEYEAFTQYRLPACSREVGHLVETSCTVLDLKGVSLSTASQVYSYIREASAIGQNYYPERMGKFYVINAPFGFSTVWAMIKRFLDPVTVEKIHILGSKYQKELLKQIPAENLPEMFGGSSTTELPIYLADAGPWRDPKFVGPEGMAPVSAKSDDVPAVEGVDLPTETKAATAAADADAETFVTAPATTN